MKYITIFIYLTVYTCNSQINNAYTLNLNNAEAHLNTNGFFFRDTINPPAGYGISNPNHAFGIYQSTFWFAAFDDFDSLHTSVIKYSVNDLKSGPISNNYNDSNYLNKYFQKIWTLNSIQIDYHINHFQDPNYIIPAQLLNWPCNGNVSNGESQTLATYYDHNHNNIYDPINGDYPIIRGDEAVYLIFNDENSNSPNTLGFEYHFMFYQYLTNDQNVNNTTFLNLAIFNKSNYNYHNLRIAQHTDYDLGTVQDDFVGSDSTRNLIYVYNQNPNDGIYGSNPPSYGVMQLNQKMDAAMPNLYNVLTGSITEPIDFWNYMNAIWPDGTHLTYGDDGHQGSLNTNYVFSGNPYNLSGWSEVTANQYSPADRSILMSSDNNDLNINQSMCIDYAYIFANHGGNNLANVNALFNVADSISDFYNSKTNYICASGQPVLSAKKIIKNHLELYPNPNNGNFSLNLNGNYELNIYNYSGQNVFYKKGSNELNTVIKTGLKSGFYIVEVIIDNERLYKKIIIN